MGRQQFLAEHNQMVKLCLFNVRILHVFRLVVASEFGRQDESPDLSKEEWDVQGKSQAVNAEQVPDNKD